jgi:manganese oxidase
MNAMGHNVPTMIGVDHRGLAKQITSVIPDYMVMGERGMADMSEMEMPIPDNTAPMMTGTGPFGPMEMGGMFTVVKVRREQPRGDQRDPGWYRHPTGTVAAEFTGTLPDTPRASVPAAASPPPGAPTPDIEVQIRKPSGHSGH